jgi:hypothetical protein
MKYKYLVTYFDSNSYDFCFDVNIFCDNKQQLKLAIKKLLKQMDISQINIYEVKRVKIKTTHKLLNIKI